MFNVGDVLYSLNWTKTDVMKILSGLPAQNVSVLAQM